MKIVALLITLSCNILYSFPSLDNPDRLLSADYRMQVDVKSSTIVAYKPVYADTAQAALDVSDVFTINEEAVAHKLAPLKMMVTQLSEEEKNHLIALYERNPTCAHNDFDKKSACAFIEALKQGQDPVDAFLDEGSRLQIEFDEKTFGLYSDHQKVLHLAGQKVFAASLLTQWGPDIFVRILKKPFEPK